jgi:hypothetical protein
VAGAAPGCPTARGPLQELVEGPTELVCCLQQLGIRLPCLPAEELHDPDNVVGFSDRERKPAAHRAPGQAPEVAYGIGAILAMGLFRVDQVMISILKGDQALGRTRPPTG